MPNKKISELTDAGTITTSDEIPLARAGRTYKAKIGLSIVPAGCIMAFAGNAVPDGWLICDGSTVPNGQGTIQGKSFNFSTLYAVVGSSLPDLRGYFIRGSGTNSDGTISGNFKEKQQDAFQGHIHTDSTFKDFQPWGGSIAVANYAYTPRNEATKTSSPVSDGTNGTPRTASETRPKNVALHYIIKY